MRFIGFLLVLGSVIAELLAFILIFSTDSLSNMNQAKLLFSCTGLLSGIIMFIGGSILYSFGNIYKLLKEKLV